MNLLLPKWNTPKTPLSPAYSPLPNSPLPEDAAVEFDLDAGDELRLDRHSPRTSADSRDLRDKDGEERGYAVATAPRTRRDRDPVLLSLVFLALGGALALFIAFPFPTTIHLFIPAAVALAAYVLVAWTRLVVASGSALRKGGPKGVLKSLARWSIPAALALVGSSALVVFWLCLGVSPPAEAVPALPPQRYFIAANLFNNEDILPAWLDQMARLIQHLGPENTFLSIYESNSKDSTPALLAEFAQRLDGMGAPHRVLSETTERWWAYGSSPERIGFLADARNRALEPLQSRSADIRLEDYASFDKVLFLNDVVWRWDAAVRLLATELEEDDTGEGYDLACGIDLFSAGIYDTWVSRDVCGTPFRVFWPYVKDPVSAARLREDAVFEVSACWNGMVAFPADNYLYRPDGISSAPRAPPTRRGWEMVDNATFPHAKASPPLTQPLKFRTSGIDSCDHSECFLFSYDLHRLFTDRRPRILMNPRVLTTYDPKWWTWNNVVLRVPVVKWWRYYWSHGVGYWTIDWLVEYFQRRRDFCTWAAMGNRLPERCPVLPGATERKWNMAG